MNKRQTNNFFIPTSFSGVSTALLQEQPDKRTGYYQRLIFTSLTRRISTLEGVDQLARQIAAIARQAYIAKQMDEVEQASQLLLALPISEKLKGVAHYYEALCRIQRCDLDGARNTFEQVVENTTPQYRARALQGIGATYYACGDVDNALPFYLAAGKASTNCDLATWVESQWMIAVVRSVHGDHRQSFNDLEKLFPLACEIGKYYPARYYDFLNSLAVELGEVGRITEAEAAINIALASPFAEAYPEWSETREEIEQKRNYPDPSRCFIERSHTESEAIPETDSSTLAETEKQTEPAISSQPQSRVEANRLRAIAFHRFIKQITCQRPSTLPNLKRAIIPGGSAKSILQLLGRSSQPRAPPASSCLL